MPSVLGLRLLQEAMGLCRSAIEGILPSKGRCTGSSPNTLLICRLGIQNAPKPEGFVCLSVLIQGLNKMPSGATGERSAWHSFLFDWTHALRDAHPVMCLQIFQNRNKSSIQNTSGPCTSNEGTHCLLSWCVATWVTREPQVRSSYPSVSLATVWKLRVCLGKTCALQAHRHRFL